MAVHAELDELSSAKSQLGVDIPSLRHEADGGVPPPRRLPEYLQCTRRGTQQSEQEPEQGRLTAAVRTEYRYEFARVDDEAGILPDQPVAVGSGQSLRDDGVPAGDCRSAHPLSRAVLIELSWATCQSWNEALPGWIVSEMPTTGMPFCLASCSRFSVTEVEVWVL